MPIRAASLKRSPMRAAPSSMEYSVCTWRCTKFWSFLGAASVDIVDESKPRRRHSCACRYGVSWGPPGRWPADAPRGPTAYVLGPLRVVGRVFSEGRDDVEGPLQVLRVGTLEVDVVARPGVFEAQPDGVQPLALQLQARGQLRVGAVGEVATARVMQRREVHPDLVGATRLEVDVEQAGVPERLDHLVVGDRRLGGLYDRELVVVTRVSPDGRVDGPHDRV